MTTPLPPWQIVERALAASRADGCVVLVQHDSEVNLRWARTTLTTNGRTAQTTVTVVAVVGTGTGTAAASLARNAATEGELLDLVAAAERAARDAADAPDAADLISGREPAPDWTSAPEAASDGVLAQVAAVLGDLFAAARADGIEHFGFARHAVITTWLGSSTGLRLRHVQPEGRLELTAKSHARSRSTWTGLATHDFADVDAPRLAGIDAGLRQALAWQAVHVDVAPGRHPALLAPSAVGDLMVDLWWSATGRDAAEGRSVFSRPGGGTRIGEQLADRPVTLLSDPAAPGLACAPFLATGMSSAYASVFDNGLPLGSTPWIDRGRLHRLITTRAGAAEAGLPLAASPDNLALVDDDGDGDLAGLIARTDRALLVTCLWYNRVLDPQTLLLTGLTRDGVYLVEHGEVVGTVGNYRFNDSPVGLLGRIRDSGASERTLPRETGDYANRVAAPALLVEDFHFSTRSDAL